MSRYFITSRTYKSFKTRGYKLVCKICGKKINVFDEVESKSSSSGPKFYHAECYDRYHLDVDEDGNILDGFGNIILKYDNEEEKE